MQRFTTAAAVRTVTDYRAPASLPYGPRGDRYVWAGHSCRANGGGQEQCGSKFSYAFMSWDGKQLGRATVKAWASPLACPIR